MTNAHSARPEQTEPSAASYLGGDVLHGDDFTLTEILRWYRSEEEGYARIWGNNDSQNGYEYHALNRRHGFRHVVKERFRHVLSIGGALGDELQPVLASADEVTVLEPSDYFKANSRIDPSKCRYVKPNSSGDLPFRDGAFDLATAFGALHHIPNVSHVLKELHRCMSDGAHAILREPIISMGDWRHPRRRLTPNERGIPLKLFRRILNDAGFAVVHETLCMFPLTKRLRAVFGPHVYNSPAAVLIDELLSRICSRRIVYHPQTILEKLQPSSVTYVLTKHDGKYPI